MIRLFLEMPSFQYIDVKSVREATFWAQKHGERAAFLGGGTDLIGLMKDRIEGPHLKIPEFLINIKTIPEMNLIINDDGAGLSIGAAVTLNRLETSQVITKNFPILRQAAHQVGTTQIRNMGTIGGNICQRPRCLYFRHPHFPCYKKGGSRCFAVSGEHRYYHAIVKQGRCVMAHPSDIALALAALGAKITIARSDEERQVPLDAFFVDANHYKETILRADEIVTEIHVPHQRSGTYQMFLKRRIRHAADFSLTSIATVAQILDGSCKEICIVLGGIAPFPYRATSAEAILRGERLNERLISLAADASLAEAHALPLNRYKLDLTKALIRRALTPLVNPAAKV